ncbi:charged multivesicular body protein 7 [Hippocampus zosterae]|uniref:charged multivesicular body protein 7 n=1 Tax=Hippocampus zosterae TaxID=109293 RepID=UPI00223CDE53|nr:charged multivesicular body protein 7 [Hippocampus zosterae]XP_051923994.1 charged multivesicular body protein 7 [Hippocampus zosterae]
MSSAVETTLPSEWDDDERMNFLFSDFKENRDVNTMDWDSKMDFWTTLVVQSCRDRRSVCVNLQDLNKTFRRKEKSPLGLTTVIQSMSRCGKLQRESEFAANVDCGWLSWGVGLLLVKPLKWTFSSLLGGNRVPLKESFVVIELVKEKAAEVLRIYQSSEFACHPVMSFQELCTLTSTVCADESTLCMALLQLQRDKQVVVSLHEGEKIVKFCQPGQSRVSTVSEVDIGIYQLQRSEKLLEERLEKLGLEADKCREEARLLLREGKKTQALRCLRGRKRVEKRADNLFGQLESIRGILDRIAQSKTDKMVLQAYQAGMASLRHSLKDVTVEGAESLLDQIQELCDKQDEVNQAISGAVTTTDDDELEEELRSLLDESSTGPEVPSLVLPSIPGDDLLDSLPAVPHTDLNNSAKQLEEQLKQLLL